MIVPFELVVGIHHPLKVISSFSFERNYTLLQNENTVHLNLKDYPSGVYMVNFDFKNNIPIRPIIIDMGIAYK